jgi:hypothetical protein
MIGIDLSDPRECRQDLIAWLKYLRFQLDSSYFPSMAAQEVAAKKKQIATYMSSVREQNNMEEMRELLHNFGVPLVVVGCKSDCLVAKDLAGLQTNEEAQRDIRHICSQGKASG